MSENKETRSKIISSLNGGNWSEVEVQREKDSIILVIRSREGKQKIFRFSAHLLRIAVYKKEKRYPYPNIDTKNFSLDLTKNGKKEATLFFESEKVLLPFQEIYKALKDQLAPGEFIKK